MIIANFTPDDIRWTHNGLSDVIKAGEIKEFEERRGKFILNKNDRKGLIQLRFGDDPEAKRVESMATWKKFWERQITMYNQDNERRKNTQKEYVEPQPELVTHSEKLGIKLVGPWTIQKTDNAAIQAVMLENVDLKAKLEALTRQMGEIADAMKAREVPFELRTAAEKVELSKRGEESQEPKNQEPPKPDHTKLVNEFSKLSTERFGEWVMTNLDRIQSTEFPPAIRTMVKEKWERLVKSDFPIPN